MGKIGTYILYYRDRVLQLISTIGAVASVSGIAVTGIVASNSMPWWAILLFVFAGLSTILAIALTLKSEGPTSVLHHGDQSSIRGYLFDWIKSGRHVAIFTRDMSWSDDPRMRGLLEHKAQANELTVVLPKSIDLTEHLREKGATIVAYGDASNVRCSFTITNFRAQGSRVAIGWRSGNYHIIQEYSAADDDPAYYLAHEIVNLAIERANERR